MQYTCLGSVLCAFDVPLGVPKGYLAAFAKSSKRQAIHFLQFLRESAKLPEFFRSVQRAQEWSIQRPFFSVPGGDGALNAFRNQARKLGIDELDRQIDKVTGAKPVFVTSGIPGSVGSAAIALWCELIPLLSKERPFRVWPFEGKLPELLAAGAVIVGEIYPGATYAAALAEAIPSPRIRVAKTRIGVRRTALRTLEAMPWVKNLGIKLDNLEHAEQSEDDFDACLTAAGLLRCVLQGLPLDAIQDHVAMAEGGMLGAGTIDFSQAPRVFRGDGVQPKPRPIQRTPVPAERRAFPCPIPGCDRIFKDSRGGWDGHVGSLRQHPDWRPEVRAASQRHQAFRLEFPEFFDEGSNTRVKRLAQSLSPEKTHASH
jgi:hypothetical protein